MQTAAAKTVSFTAIHRQHCGAPTINRYVKRGTLDDDLAEAMKKLAKDKMLRAKSDVAYAKGDYEKEIEQAALRKEAQAKM